MFVIRHQASSRGEGERLIDGRRSINPEYIHKGGWMRGRLGAA
ncbi:MAG TPA: hypothetical protein VF510_24825 [Ktedonobacterales bacterium]